VSDIIKEISLDVISKLADDTAAKEVVSPYIPDDVKKYIEENRQAWKADDKHIYLLVVALSASDFFGPNTRGDYFPESALLGIQHDWEAKRYNPKGKKDTRVPRYKTFEWAKVYRDHNQNQPIGDVLKAFWDDDCKRVLCVVRVSKDLAPDVEQMIASGMRPAFSMGLKEPFDFCLHPDMPVFTQAGWRKIKEVKVDDYVFTSSRAFKRVKGVSSSFPEERVSISTSLMPDLVVSPNHFIFIEGESGLVKRPACQLNIGDKMVIPLYAGCEDDDVNSNNVILSSMFRRDSGASKEKYLGEAIGLLFNGKWAVRGKWYSISALGLADAEGLLNAFWSLGIPARLDSHKLFVYTPGLVYSLLGCDDYIVEPKDIDGLGVYFNGTHIVVPITEIRRSANDEEFFDLTVEEDENYLSYFLVSNCSICGYKRTPGDVGCLHTRLSLNEFDEHTRKKIYRINKVFFFHDLSVVGQNPADKTAWGLLKVASEKAIRSGSTSQNIEKTVFKRHPATVIEPDSPSGKVFMRVQMLSGSERPFNDSVLSALAKRGPDAVFSALMKLGMVLSPSEYYKYRLAGGDKLESPPAPPSDVAMDSVMPVLEPMMSERSCLYEPMRARIIRMIIIGKRPDPLPDASKVGSEYLSYRDSVNAIVLNKEASAASVILPAAGFFAPYYLSAHYRRRAFEGYPQGMIARAVSRYALPLAVAGAIGAPLAAQKGKAWVKALYRGLSKAKVAGGDENMIIADLLADYEVALN